MWDSPASIYNHKNTNISNILLLHDCSWIVIAYLVHDISQQMKGPSWPFIDWRERGKKPWFPLFTEILYWQKSSYTVLARRAKRQWKLTHSSSSNKLEREHDSDGEAGVLWHKQIIQEGSPQEKKKVEPCWQCEETRPWLLPFFSCTEDSSCVRNPRIKTCRCRLLVFVSLCY